MHQRTNSVALAFLNGDSGKKLSCTNGDLCKKIFRVPDSLALDI